MCLIFLNDMQKTLSSALKKFMTSHKLNVSFSFLELNESLITQQLVRTKRVF